MGHLRTMRKRVTLLTVKGECSIYFLHFVKKRGWQVVRKAKRKSRTFTVSMGWDVFGLLSGLAQVIPEAAERGNVSATVRGLVAAEAERRGLTQTQTPKGAL